MKSWIRYLERLAEQAGRAVSWLTLLMVITTFFVVVLRYAFDLGWIAMQESVTYMHATVFMLGASFALKHQQHVRVDIFYRKMSRRGQAFIDLFGALFLLIPTCVFIAWDSWEYVSAAWEVKESSREAGGIPAVYLLKSLLTLMPVLLLAQAIASVLSNLYLIGQGKEQEGIDG